jgi:hypothetical protein
VRFIGFGLIALFFAASIGSDICFGQLLKRGYLAAPEDWKREGRPTWWTWRPPEMRVPSWYYHAPRWRWLLSSPSWTQIDPAADAWQLGHQVLTALSMAAWGALLFLGFTGQFSN